VQANCLDVAQAKAGKGNNFRRRKCYQDIDERLEKNVAAYTQAYEDGTGPFADIATNDDTLIRFLLSNFY